MSVTREELQAAAQKVFGDGTLVPDREQSWQHIAEQGWLMMMVPEERGGLGLGREAAAVVHYELGRALVPGPLIGQLAAIEALVVAKADDEILESAMAGEKIALSLELANHGRLYRGVVDADEATYFLALHNDRLGLFELASDDVEVTAQTSWDESRRLFEVRLNKDASPAITLAEGEQAWSFTNRMKLQIALGFAGDCLGGASAMLEKTVEYLQTRRQFDRPLAMFQALKHRVADMQTWRVAAEALDWARAKASDSTVTQMGAMKAHAAHVYSDICEEAIQLHGGIGLTEEYHCHLFMKRAMLNAALGGDADLWEEGAGKRLFAIHAD